MSDQKNTLSILPDKFFYGASVYPDMMPREQWLRMLDLMKKARMNLVRIVDSEWGNIERKEGQFDFGWLNRALDDLHERGFKVIVGTSSYIMPQWLAAKHPEVLGIRPEGEVEHPMLRQVACFSEPAYRQAVRNYVTALAREVKDHPAVVGWQLDNEIEFRIPYIDQNPANTKAWHKWLKDTYHTVDEFNEQLLLISWAMRVADFKEVRLPNSKHMPALNLAHLHFSRDVIFDFFREQRDLLRQLGVKQWIMTDWIFWWKVIGDDPQAQEIFDLAGQNFYQPTKEDPAFWSDIAWHFDKSRSAHGLGYFLATETTVGVTGDVKMWTRSPSKDQFRMWMLHPAAYGAFGLMYWSSNRWHGGHWPHWGALLDWTGEPEKDFDWVVELGEFFDKWSDRLLKNPVKAEAAVLTDFDNRAALEIYPHTEGSKLVMRETFDLLHRLGIGTDTVNSKIAENADNLKKYSLVVIPAATSLDGDAVPTALKKYVEQGGNVLITPFTAYMNWSGVFRNDGFAANLSELTGVLVRTVRMMGTAAKDEVEDIKVAWALPDVDGESAVGITGFCEFLEVGGDTEVIAAFKTNETLLNGKPAATRKKVGKGTVIKLGFWPADDSIGMLIRDLVPRGDNLLKKIAPKGVQIVPRTDKSSFVINTTNKEKEIELVRPAKDRISGEEFKDEIEMPPYGVFWLE